jgi:hypothetical protein
MAQLYNLYHVLCIDISKCGNYEATVRTSDISIWPIIHFLNAEECNNLVKMEGIVM